VEVATAGHEHIQQFTWAASTAALESVLAAPARSDAAVGAGMRP
jgi:hypothetical protein